MPRALLIRNLLVVFLAAPSIANGALHNKPVSLAIGVAILALLLRFRITTEKIETGNILSGHIVVAADMTPIQMVIFLISKLQKNKKRRPDDTVDQSEV